MASPPPLPIQEEATAAAWDIVVARHREDLAWLRATFEAHRAHGGSLRVFVYDKSGDPPPPSLPAGWHWVPLANRGREAHAYFHHLATRWHDMADATLFLQGHPFDHLVSRSTAVSLPPSPLTGFEPYDARMVTETHPRGDCGDLPLAVYRALASWGLLSATAPAVEVRFPAGAQFAVSCAAARSRHREWYAARVREMEAFGDQEPATYTAVQALAGAGRLDAWTAERLWPIVFDVGGGAAGEMVPRL